MAQNVNPTFVKTPNNGTVQITSATSNAFVTVYTGGTNGSKVVGLIATGSTNLSGAVDVQWGILNATSSFSALGASSVPITAGYASSVPAINLMNTVNTPGMPLDSDGNVFVFLKSSADTLSARTPGVVITAGTINLTAFSGDF